jgi:3-oxoacyl-[acyl-carrier-protein] synthase-3
VPEAAAAARVEPAARTERTLRGAAIAGLGAALPPTVVPNAQIAERLGVDDHWIQKRLGISERRFVADEERLDDLAAEASVMALERAGIPAAEVDLVLVCTVTQDEIMPNTAPLVAGKIGAGRAGAADVGSACLGFVSGLALATAQIEANRADVVLLVGAEMLSRYLDPDDRRTAPLFGDGAGAVVMTAVDPPGRIGPCILRADDAGRELVRIDRVDEHMRMEGQETFVYAVDYVSDVTLQAVAAAGLTLDDVDVFAYHQGNARILKSVGERLGLDGAKVVNCIAELGNTSSASIPLALHVAEREGRLFDGARVLVSGIGAGWTWGAAVLEWGTDGV